MPPETQVLNNYISILEKTNQQLNLWSNPYGLMVGILTLLVALIAIGVAYALWRHSKEQRDRTNQFFTEQEKIINEINKQVQKAKEGYNDLIKEQEGQLKSSTKKGKKEIQKAIEELKKEKARINAYMGPVMVAGGTSTILAGHPLSIPQSITFNGLGGKKSMICTRCGKNFSYYNNSEGSTLGGDSILEVPYSDTIHGYGTYGYGTTFKDKDVYCIFCGAKNIPL